MHSNETKAAFYMVAEKVTHCHRGNTTAISLCPPKFKIFAWQLSQGRVMVRSLLVKYGLIQMVDVYCPIYKEAEESMDHLFLHCSWSKNLWAICMSWWDVIFCANNSLKEWIAGWKGLCPALNSLRAWNTLLVAVSWMIWEEQNQLVFKNREVDVNRASDLVKFRVA